MGAPPIEEGADPRALVGRYVLALDKANGQIVCRDRYWAGVIQDYAGEA